LFVITIALTRYNEPDALLQQCLKSIAAQESVRATVFVLDQKAHPETRVLCEALSSQNVIFEYRVIPARGCAHARNIAIGLCPTDILLWTDPDILLPPCWAGTLSRALLDGSCEIVGGKILPNWCVLPRWYIKSSVMADHYSLMDLGPGVRKTDRIIGGSMGFHVRRLGRHACFDERLGRKNGKFLGGVDTEFCERAIRHGFTVRYIGRPVALHQIPKSRMHLSWIIKKFYYGGFSRGFRGGRPSAMNKKRKIADYMVLGAFAPFYLFGLLNGMANKNTGLPF
jgi:glycosyltransferase involved in cell wall biosynthesis